MNREVEPVLIAGAGPVGCVLALYLAQNNVPVRILEAAKDLNVDLRASTFHPPTLDMLDELGLTPRLIEQGLLVRSYQYRDRTSGDIAEFHFDLLSSETSHPYRLQCEQYKMTRICLDMLSDYKVASVDFATKVLGFQQDDRSVHALAFGKNGEERITGSFLIGADGADSRVRQSAGILYEGLTYPELFLVIGTTFPFEEHIPNLSPVNYVSDPDEWCVLLKTDESWRVLVPTEVGADREKLLSDSFIGSRLKRIVPEAEGSQVLHRSLYHVHQRVAETYRIGRRVVLAGDAAHINNPLGGMGMNGGIHDAINLGEKLVEIIRRGGAPDKLLDLYERQRRGICIRFVQEHTKANKALMEASEREQQRERQENLMRAAKSPAEAKAFLMRNSMIDCVRDSYRIK